MFRIQVRRKSFAFAIRIISWLFLLSLTNFFIFAFNGNNLGDRLAFSLGLIFAIVAFQFIISDKIPNLPYLTIIDRYNLIVLAFTLLTAFQSVVIGWKSQDSVDEDEIDDINKYDYFCLVIIGVLYVLTHLMFALYVWQKIKEENGKIGQSFVSTHQQGLAIIAHKRVELQEFGILYQQNASA